MELGLWIADICLVGLFFIFALFAGLTFCHADNSYGDEKKELMITVNKSLLLSLICGILALIVFCFIVPIYT